MKISNKISDKIVNLILEETGALGVEVTQIDTDKNLFIEIKIEKEDKTKIKSFTEWIRESAKAIKEKENDETR